MSRYKKFFCGAGMLAFCTVVAKILGACFRIPLTNILGAEGMGLYQMVFPLYTVLLTLSSGGMPVAIARVVAAKVVKRDYKGTKKVLWVSIAMLSLVGTVVSLAVIALNTVIAQAQGNIHARLAIVGIAPAILIVGLIGAFKGYFQGRQNMLPSSITQIVEQLTKLTVGLGLGIAFLPSGIQYAVLGAILGVTASELVALIMLVSFYFLTKRDKKTNYQSQLLTTRSLATEVALDWNLDQFANNANPKPTESKGSILKSLYKVAIPVSLGILILPLIQVVDSISVINFLVGRGVGRAAATAQYGLLNGPVSSLINLPVVINMAISIALMPKVTSSFSNGKTSTELVNNSMRHCLLLSIPIFFGMLIYAKDIIQLLYGSGLSVTEQSQAIQILKLSSIIVVYASFVQICTATMQGCNMPARPAIILAISAVFKVVATLVLLYCFGIYGVAIATVIFYVIAALLNIKSCQHLTSLKDSFGSLSKIAIAAIIAFGLGFATKIWVQRYVSNLLSLVIVGLITGAIYIVLCIILGCIHKSELGFGDKLKIQN